MRYLRSIIVGTAVACMVAVALAGATLASASAPGVTALPNRPVCPGPASFGAVDCHARVITDRGGTPMATTGPTGYSPAQFHSAYELPTGSPTPQTIAIVDAYDDPTVESDLAVYDATFGLPACTTANGCFLKVNQSGNQGPYPKADPGWALEIALDVETAHAICQNCKIILVETESAYFSDLTVGVKTAADMGATQISNSYGGPEYSGEKSDLAYKYPGVAVTVSAGDDGYAAEYPASSPYVIAVGGTTLSLGAANSYGSESVWSGSGSGCSAYISAQPWQTADPKWGPTGCGSKRGVADVAADADPNSGASIYDTTKDQGQAGWFKVGGTSLSAPLIAAVYALAGGSSSDYPAADPYEHQADSPASLHDVTTGTNGSCGGSTMCKGAVGYDGPTGVGTPKGVAAFSGAGGATDTTPPQTTIDSGPSGTTNDPTPTFAFSSNEAGSTFKCRIDAASFAACTSPYTANPALTDGPHTFEVFATDKAANADPTPAARSFSVDTIAPQVDLTTPAAGSTTANPTPALSGTAGTAAGDSATVTIRVYAGSGTGGTLVQTRSATRDPSTGAYSVAATSLASGTYTAQASQADSAANTGQSPARTFSVDVTPPQTTIDSGPSGATNDPTPTFAFSSNEVGSTFECRVDAAAFSSCTSPLTTASLADGSHTFEVRATDGAGNADPSPATRSFSVDSTPEGTAVEEQTVEEPGGEETPPPAPTPLAPQMTPLPDLLVAPVTSPPTVRLGRARIDVGGISATLTVRISSPGQLVLAGRKVRRVARVLGTAGHVALPVRLRKRFLSPPTPAIVTVTYTPSSGAPIVKSTTVRFG